MKAITAFRRSSVLAGALLSLVAASPIPAFAAADNTRGMAFLAAHVLFDGFLEEKSGATDAFWNSTSGSYFVTFDRDVAGCFYVVTPQGNVNGMASNVAGNTNVVQVTLEDKNDVATPIPFYLLVYCAK